MARFIPVNGPISPEAPLFDLMRPFANTGRLVSFEKLEDGRTILSHLDIQDINTIATELAGKTIYGDAVIFSDSDRSGG